MKNYYALVCAFFLLASLTVQAQTAVTVQYRPARGLSDPELPDPRYAGALEVSELKEQVKMLTDAYGRLIEEHNLQADRLQSLERTVRTAGPPAPRELPNSIISIRKL